MSGTTTTRRDFLAATGTLGVGALAGCSGASGQSAVTVLSAGSLVVAFTDAVGPAFEAATDRAVRGEFHGSKTVMRMVRDGQTHPDVVVSADARLLRESLEEGANPIATWDVAFASNEVGITYASNSAVGERLAAGEPWYEVLREADAEIARSDPELDPLGYRTVMLFELAERYYDEPGLARELCQALHVDPSEAHLLAGVETGDRVAAVTYRNMAIDHGLAYLSLPGKLNFSTPSHADYYDSVGYTTESGQTIHGRPVLYNVTVPTAATNAEGGREFVRFLASNPGLLTENGLRVPPGLPRSHGPVPEGVLP